MIKNIVFDFGGVIVDIDRDKAVQAFIKLGLTDADSRLDKYHQTGIFQELEEGKLSADEFRKQLGDLCGREAYYGRNQTGMAGLLQRSRFAQT